MSTSKVSISLDSNLRSAVTQAAERLDLPVSEWFAQAAAAKLRNQLLGDFLDDWEATHGAFTQDELRAAEDRLRPRNQVSS
jgi:hypothetical protein